MSAAVAVGVFDGVHLGHQRILARAVEKAREHRARCVVLSFDPHPDLVLAKDFQPTAPLTPIPEKRCHRPSPPTTRARTCTRAAGMRAARKRWASTAR